MAGVLGGVLAAEGRKQWPVGAARVRPRRALGPAVPAGLDQYAPGHRAHRRRPDRRRGPTTMAHPPPPWHLFGELIIVPALVRPRALGGVMLANYTSGTLVYRELIVFAHATAARDGRQPHLRRRRAVAQRRPRDLGPAEGAGRRSSYTPTRFVAPPGRPHAAATRASAAGPGGPAAGDPRADRQPTPARRSAAPGSRPRPRWSRSTSRRPARSPAWACAAPARRSRATTSR